MKCKVLISKNYLKYLIIIVNLSYISADLKICSKSGCALVEFLRGSSGRKWSKLSNFCFLLKKCLQVWGHHIPNFYGASGTRTPTKWGKKGGAKGGGFVFFVFNRKRKGKWKKYFVHFVGNLSRIPKLSLFLF